MAKCCGERRKAKAAAQARAALPGAGGFRLLRRVGGEADGRWRGPATGTLYRFGPGAEKLVDVRDAEGLLALGGGRLFEAVEEGDGDRRQGD